MSAVAKRYARAAVDAAREKGGDSEVQSLAVGLRAFADAYRLTQELHEVVLNPSFADARQKVITSVGEKIGASHLTTNLVLLLCDNERMGELEEVAAEVEAIADEELGRARAKVISAIEVSEAQTKRLVAALEKRLGTPVILDVQVDPALLGGLVIEVGSVTIDSSLRRQLEIMSERLANS